MAFGYAVPVFLVALLVRIEETVTLGTLVTGELRVSLSGWQALVFPLLLAAAAGAAGGLWALLAARSEDARARTLGAALAGGWRMLWLGLALSYAGLFVAGVVQPDEPVAALTPSTARYFEVVFERPGAGAAILAHHLASGPNEAVWTLIPAAGGCDGVRGSAEVDFLCYRRFPRSVGSTIGPVLPGESAAEPADPSFGSAPAGYLSFLLVPAAATLLGGRAAARRMGERRCAGARAGLLAGLVFAVLVGVTSVLAGVSLSYGATLGERGGGGYLWIGPHVASAVLLGLAWGVLGGVLGGATAGVRSVAGPPAGRAPRAPR